MTGTPVWGSFVFPFTVHENPKGLPGIRKGPINEKELLGFLPRICTGANFPKD